MQFRARFSFSRSSRLVKPGDYSRVFSNNVRIGDDCFTVLIGKAGSEQARIGFAVAKKQIKKAVDRNRIKRQIRESFRLKQVELPKHDLVVMVRSKILDLSHQQIQQRLQKHWRTVAKKCEKF